MGCCLSKYAEYKAKFIAWLFDVVRGPKTRIFFKARHRSPYEEEPFPFPEGILPPGKPDPVILRSPQATAKRLANRRRGKVTWEMDLPSPKYRCLTPLPPAVERSRPQHLYL